ncbi:MAG: creatininase family protein [bacterium]|nr:creatininase family protein [bacterium]
MRLQDLNWMDVERYLEQDNRIILITGATEQHAYLSLMTDILIPEKIADAVSKREHVLVAPPLNFGVSRYFLEFPGTISLSQHTFDYCMLEIIESLLHQGFRRFFILNGHGGNKIPERLFDFQMEGIIRVTWYDWWHSDAAQAFAGRHGLSIQHANWGENFPFNRVTDSPAQDKPLVNLAYGDDYFSVRSVLGDGSYGGPYQVDDTLMYMLFDEVVEEATMLLRELAAEVEE